MKRYILKCEALSPLHIGSGEEIEVYDYVITKKLYKLDLNKLLSVLTPSECENVLKMLENNIVSYKNFLLKIFNEKDFLLPKVSSFSILISKAVSDFYNEKSNDPMNLLPVKLFQRNFNGPYVPGSSLKGAIRTAILFNRFHPGLHNQLRKNLRDLTSSKWEEKVLNCSSPQDDPFKAVKISDSFGKLQTVVLNARVHTLRKGRWERDRYQILFEGVYKETFEVELRIDTELQDNMEKVSVKAKRITAEEIIKSCRKFYYANFEKELKRLAGNNSVSFYANLQSEMQKMVDDNNKNLTFPLRVGWGSGFEAVTLGLNDSFKELIKAFDQRLLRPISSVKLVQDCLPLGWLKVTMEEI